MLRNVQHEKFSHEYVLTGNAAQSALQAGYSESSSKAYGNRLLKRDDVRKRIAEIRRGLSKSLHFDVEDAIIELDVNRQDAREAGNASAMNQATIAKVKILGLDKPVDEGEYANMSTEQLLELYDKQHDIITKLRNS